jgi:hypothetical protein
MKFSIARWLSRQNRASRHEFTIGPLSANSIFPERARVYHCIRCKWSFLVCNNRIVVIDENQTPLGGAEGVKRFSTFSNGPCPALTTSDAGAPRIKDTEVVQPRRHSNESRHLAPIDISAWAGRAGSLLRISNRLRENLGGYRDLSHMHRRRTHLRLPGNRNDSP